MTSLRDWLYAKLLQPPTADSDALIDVAKYDIQKQYDLRTKALDAGHRERLLAMWLSFILALLMAATTFVAIWHGHELAAVASSAFGGVSSVCGSILAVRRCPDPPARPSSTPDRQIE
jgi:uncharacterized membrane protein